MLDGSRSYAWWRTTQPACAMLILSAHDGNRCRPTLSHGNMCAIPATDQPANKVKWRLAVWVGILFQTALCPAFVASSRRVYTNPCVRGSTGNQLRQFLTGQSHGHVCIRLADWP